MSSLFDRVGKVVKSEWNSRFSDEDSDAASTGLPEKEVEEAESELRESLASTLPKAKKSVRRQGISDALQALRMLELGDEATLDEVRARYFELATRYHPRTVSGTPDQAYAAQTVLATLTDALEILECHMLPVS
ncbi:MAG: J domain-containing protein [Deltaproteobacteria bacterium]|nr:J domain-containing protein [Deltaproteobacteria bacterium]